jgi:hypothetical protein
MKEEHLTLAYELAQSDVPTENLCDPATFATRAPTLSLLEREMIGAEATFLRGNELYDWIEPGVRVEFWTQDRYDRMSGVVQQLQPKEVDGAMTVMVKIRTPRGIVETFIDYCRRPR